MEDKNNKKNNKIPVWQFILGILLAIVVVIGSIYIINKYNSK